MVPLFLLLLMSDRVKLTQTISLSHTTSLSDGVSNTSNMTQGIISHPYSSRNNDSHEGEGHGREVNRRRNSLEPANLANQLYASIFCSRRNNSVNILDGIVRSKPRGITHTPFLRSRRRRSLKESLKRGLDDIIHPKVKDFISTQLDRVKQKVQDFTQLNMDVCPPSLCQAFDELTRRVVSRPRGTGGSVFYQGDIVLDSGLDRFFFPKIAAPLSKQLRNGPQRNRPERRKNRTSQGKQNIKSRNRDSKETKRTAKTERNKEGKKSNKNSEEKDRNHNGKLNERKSRNKTRRKRVKRSIITSNPVVDNEAMFKNRQWRTEERSGRRKRATLKIRKRLWKNGVVVYRMSNSISDEAKKILLRAMYHIRQRTCIRFREKKSSDKDFIRFISEPGCWSQIGRVGGPQMISIGQGCENLGTAVHEIVHALGVWHEQARPDRNKYVRILEDNVSDRFLPDFEPISRRLTSDRGYDYDYQSLMHYSKNAFTRNGEPTIQVIGVGQERKLRIGQRRGLSTIDISQIRDMYKCNFKEDSEQSVCHKGWEKYGKSCYKFVPSPPAQFNSAFRACKSLKAQLLRIGNKKEQRYITKYINEKFPQFIRWRTAGRKVDDKMVWYLGEKSVKPIGGYTNWARGHPRSRTSMILQRDPQSGKVTWAGEWMGDASRPEAYRHPYICEKPAWRKCVELRHPDGRDYRGDLDHTREGYTCQKWSENYPHNHPLVNASRAVVAAQKSRLRNSRSRANSEENEGLGNHNKCRNPSGLRRNRPWCYTTKRKHEWGYCDVSVCAGSLRRRRQKVQQTTRRTSGRGASRRSRRKRHHKGHNKPKIFIRVTASRQRDEITHKR